MEIYVLILVGMGFILKRIASKSLGAALLAPMFLRDVTLQAIELKEY